MIKVSVEVHQGEAQLRTVVSAESITRAISAIERRHPGRKVRVVFPIDPEEFFVEGPWETGVGRDESRRLLHDPAMSV